MCHASFQVREDLGCCGAINNLREKGKNVLTRRVTWRGFNFPPWEAAVIVFVILSAIQICMVARLQEIEGQPGKYYQRHDFWYFLGPVLLGLFFAELLFKLFCFGIVGFW